MSLKDKCIFLGLGNYGGKQMKEFISLDYNGNAANGSSQDLKVLGDVSKYHLNGFDGFGGNRERALECLEQNQEFLEFVQNIKSEIIFLIFSGGGSFGSGCGTILSDMLAQPRNKYGHPQKIICPIIALPSTDEAVKKHQNAYDTVLELQEIAESGTRLDATFFINNNTSITNGKDKIRDYQYINRTFAIFLDTFLSNDTYGELNNFDESERIEMLRNGGMMVMGLMNPKNLDQALILQKLTSNGIFTPIENDRVCENIAIVHAGHNNSDIDKDSIIAEVGRPRNIFEGYNGQKTFVAVSGLSYPVSHIHRLGESAKAAYEERRRSRTRVDKLDIMDFTESEDPRPSAKTDTKPTKWEVLKRKIL